MNLGLTSGDATGALALAKQSTRTERNPAALELVLEAHCQLKQKKSAKNLLRHIPEKTRPALIADCAARRVTRQR